MDLTPAAAAATPLPRGEGCTSRQGVGSAEAGALEAFGLVELAEVVDEGVDFAFHDAGQVAEADVDAVVGDTVLREVVGADLFAAIAGADLGAAGVAALLHQALLLHVVEARAEDEQGLGFVLQLRLLVLAGDDHAGREVRDADGAVGGIDALAAVAAGAVDVDPQVVLVDLDVHVL